MCSGELRSLSIGAGAALSCRRFFLGDGRQLSVSSSSGDADGRTGCSGGGETRLKGETVLRSSSEDSSATGTLRGGWSGRRLP